jgi:HSP20 family molecular chaperone IbpA
MLPTFFKNTPMEYFLHDEVFDRSFLKSPKSEVKRLDDGGYQISMALIGFTKENLSIETSDETITISGEIDGEKPRFVSQTKFKKSWTLENLDADSVDAKLDSGILTVTLKSKEAVASDVKTVEIK